jgi:hypothetical protein
MLPAAFWLLMRHQPPNKADQVNEQSLRSPEARDDVEDHQ